MLSFPAPFAAAQLGFPENPPRFVKTDMLNLFDNILYFLFACGIPLLVTLWAVGFASLALLHLFSDAPLSAKAELLGLSVCCLCTCYWFWVWKDQMDAGGTIEGYAHVPSSLALLVSAGVLGVLSALRDHFILYCVTGCIYLAIILLVL